jgi:BirA family biotin operon repressor/biotin-[acetyl-CoA-carboxylase] ligase
MNTKKISITTITKINCFLVKRLLSRYIKKKIIYKKPNDLLIDKKKISGILQETIFVSDKIFLITGIGININKNPNIKNHPTINMSELTGKTVSKVKIENNLKQLFEKNFSRIYN